MKRTLAVALLVFFVIFSVFAEDGSTERPTVALVLSGGGAKGLAHIPIIEALESHGIPIDKVFGTSIGALIGGLYSAGYSPGDMRRVVTSDDLSVLFTSLTSTGYTEVLNAFDFSSNNVMSLSLSQGIGGVNGLLDDYLILNFFEKCIGNVPDGIDFDKDLVIPFECNATDMVTGKEIYQTKGSLITALRSSMSIPVAFESVDIQNAVLVDGGLSCNTMVQRAIDEGFDIVICIDLMRSTNEKTKSKETLGTLSGMAMEAFTIVLANISGDDADKAQYMFTPDTTDVGVLDFGNVEFALGTGEKEVADKADLFKEIAACFSEDQLDYRDPDRVGEYFTKYPERQTKQHRSSAEVRHEDLLGRTRISLGLYGATGLNFHFKEEAGDYTRAFFYPTVSLRSYLKSIQRSNFSMDIRFKSTPGKTTDVSLQTLYEFDTTSSEHVYLMAKVGASIGSLTYLTDDIEPASMNTIEGSVCGDFGFTVTNETDHSLSLYASADNLWLYPLTLYGKVSKNYTSDDAFGYEFLPRLTFEAVFYPAYTNGIFVDRGSRYDIKASVAYNRNESVWEYMLGLAGVSTIKLSETTAIWLDATAFTSRCDLTQRRTYMQYGGWRGMPGYGADTRYTDFIYGGAGVQIRLNKGILSDFLSIVVRGGVRSDHLYGEFTQFYNTYRSWIPFSDCFDSPNWDLGASIGFGLNSPVGDIIVGAGYNLRQQLTIFLELT